MASRQRIATGFLALACLVILICMTQRVASLHALQMPVTATASLSESAPDSAESAITPCELSAKTLLMAAPLLFDSALPALVILLMVLAAGAVIALIFPPARACRAPLLRIHLINCNFRE